MKVAELSQERLAEFATRFQRARIAVLGDFFLDRYLDVDPALEELSVETGEPAHQVVGVRCRPGAAGTVVSNLVALGAGRVHAVGFTGADGEGYELRQALAALSCTTTHLHEVATRRTPTYLKPRDAGVATLAGEHSRYDTKNRSPTPSEVQEQVLRSVETLLNEVDALVVVDQVEADGGVVPARVRGGLADWAKRFPHVVFWADSREHVREYRGVLIKPNQFEATGVENRPGAEVTLDVLQAAVARLRVQNGAAVAATRGALGMLVTDPEWTLVPGVVVAGDVDPTGAGDSATAGAVLALCAGAELPEACVVANIVASITVEQIGTTGVAHVEQLPERLELWGEQQQA